MVFDSSGNLYVANQGNNTVSKFAPGSTTASATYSAGLSGPGALAFDAGGNLYVANDFAGTVSKFAPGSTTASATYTAGVSGPDALAIDVSGNLYVANRRSQYGEQVCRRQHHRRRHIFCRTVPPRCSGGRLQRQSLRSQ